MEKSSFFNSVDGDRKYKAEEFANYFGSFIGNGVFPDSSDGLQIISNNDMTVTVQAGKAWINGYMYENTDDFNLSIDVADGVLNRNDRVVLRWDAEGREIRIKVKKGTLASSPVAPALQRDANAYELGLADIKVNAGIVSILQSNITDLRYNIDLCGVVNTVIKADLPTGLISMWSGLISDIPNGWVLCNGQNGTPNLSDRFIMGAVTDATINKTGGSNTVTLTKEQLPAHNHTGSADSAGAHTHTYDRVADGSQNIQGTGYGTATFSPKASSSAGAHVHTLSIANTGSGQAHENRPAFYTLAFIMKI